MKCHIWLIPVILVLCRFPANGTAESEIQVTSRPCQGGLYSLSMNGTDIWGGSETTLYKLNTLTGEYKKRYLGVHSGVVHFSHSSVI